jgi:hypothetical protein
MAMPAFDPSRTLTEKRLVANGDAISYATFKELAAINAKQTFQK